jgi:AcrR family transcriptional regulator
MVRRQDDTSAALIDAAHRLLIAEGLEALTVRRIAAEAGMSTMNVYSRFGGKDGVLDVLYRDGFRRLLEALDAVPVTRDDYEGEMLACALAYRRFALENPQYYDIMFRHFDGARDYAELARGGLRTTVERLQAKLDQGVPLPQGMDALGLIVWLWSMCHGMISLELDGMGSELVDWDQLYRAGVGAAARGIVSGRVPTSPG